MLETLVKLSSDGKQRTQPQVVEHPVRKMARENSGMGTGVVIGAELESRSLAFEDENRYKSRQGAARARSNSGQRTSLHIDNLSGNGSSVFLTNIPDSVAIKDGDPHSTRLPIFGNRTSMLSRGSNTSRCSSVASSSINKSRSTPEEISEKFLKKMNSNYYEVRKKFLDNDPEQKGNVTRDALMRILQLCTSCHVNKSSLDSVLEIWGLKQEKQIFSFAEINSISMKKSKTGMETGFVDPVSRQKSTSVEVVQMKCVKVLKLLKEKIGNKDIYLTDMFPESVDSTNFSFNASQLKRALNKLLVDLSPQEMDKLWLKLDPQKTGSITGLAFLKNLGIISQPQQLFSPKFICHPEQKDPTEIPNSFESQLKAKLREGFKKLGADFRARDVSNSGLLLPDIFLAVLAEHSLQLEKSQLAEFLVRCQVTPTRDGIPYSQLLDQFQDRSDAGATHRLLMSDTSKTKKNANQLTVIEMKLVNMFQKDFLDLLNGFRSHDKTHSGFVILDDFRAVIEQKLGIRFSDEHFRSIIDNLPLTQELKVPYLDFLKQFDTGNLTPIFQSNYQNNEQRRSESIDDGNSSKTLEEIKRIMKLTFDTRFSELEATFEEVDESNTNQLTVEMMVQLFKRLNTSPELTRGDIRNVWNTFILNERRMLDYKEFVRHFVYNRNTASFPNAKICPPVKGDADLIKRSNKLSGANDIIMDGLRSKLEIFHKDLLKEFLSMDPSGSGSVDVEDFKEIMKELSIHLTDTEVDRICKKFVKTGTNLNYVTFLRPYSRISDEKIESSQNQRKNPKNLEKSELSSNMETFLEKMKVITQTTVKRAIKKLDNCNLGYIPFDDLKAILLSEGVYINEEESFELMNRYDSSLSGNINYTQLIKDVKC